MCVCKESDVIRRISEYAIFLRSHELSVAFSQKCKVAYETRANSSEVAGAEAEISRFKYLLTAVRSADRQCVYWI